jgi:hypothetical protein
LAEVEDLQAEASGTRAEAHGQLAHRPAGVLTARSSLMPLLAQLIRQHAPP